MLVYLAMIPTEEGRNKFALLYWEYRDLMFYLALRILGSQQDAEDAVQEALLRIICYRVSNESWKFNIFFD